MGAHSSQLGHAGRDGRHLGHRRTNRDRTRSLHRCGEGGRYGGESHWGAQLKDAPSAADGKVLEQLASSLLPSTEQLGAMEPSELQRIFFTQADMLKKELKDILQGEVLASVTAAMDTVDSYIGGIQAVQAEWLQKADDYLLKARSFAVKLGLQRGLAPATQDSEERRNEAWSSLLFLRLQPKAGTLRNKLSCCRRLLIMKLSLPCLLLTLQGSPQPAPFHRMRRHRPQRRCRARLCLSQMCTRHYAAWS
uniref:Uncharacterized protein n=1 Tax=Arundo donax TaxID=35708 RepID=A0A0A8YKH5_ARUDO